MTTIIKCELMEEWNFDTCLECKRFRMRIGKGLKNWGCTLNNATAAERREFGMIWALNYLSTDEHDFTTKVEITYVGKKKRRKIKK